MATRYIVEYLDGEQWKRDADSYSFMASAVLQSLGPRFIGKQTRITPIDDGGKDE
jgi:hypothetical protein